MIAQCPSICRLEFPRKKQIASLDCPCHRKSLELIRTETLDAAAWNGMLYGCIYW